LRWGVPGLCRSGAKWIPWRVHEGRNHGFSRLGGVSRKLEANLRTHTERFSEPCGIESWCD
jgi:hypothetical protein